MIADQIDMIEHVDWNINHVKADIDRSLMKAN